jgi:hypothetical protein
MLWPAICPLGYTYWASLTVEVARPPEICSCSRRRVWGPSTLAAVQLALFSAMPRNIWLVPAMDLKTVATQRACSWESVSWLVPPAKAVRLVTEVISETAVCSWVRSAAATLPCGPAVTAWPGTAADETPTGSIAAVSVCAVTEPSCELTWVPIGTLMTSTEVERVKVSIPVARTAGSRLIPNSCTKESRSVPCIE